MGLVGGGGTDPYEARNGVVMIGVIAQDSQGNTASGMGTGFAIGNPGEPVEYIVTNGHVVQKAYDIPELIRLSPKGSSVYSAAENDYVQAQVVYYSSPSEKDIAILKLPSPTDKRVPLKLRESDSVSTGETAYALGFPADSAYRQNFATFGLDDITMTRGIISKRLNPVNVTYEAFQMDVSIAGGNSGGPLVDENGNVIGINTLGATDPQTGVPWA